MLRLCFKYDRKLLGELSRCFYHSIKEISLAAAAQGESFAPKLAPLPALISSVQTYGDDPMRFHPHLHCLAADGLLAPEGSIFPLPRHNPARTARAEVCFGEELSGGGGASLEPAAGSSAPVQFL